MQRGNQSHATVDMASCPIGRGHVYTFNIHMHTGLRTRHRVEVDSVTYICYTRSIKSAHQPQAISMSCSEGDLPFVGYKPATI